MINEDEINKIIGNKITIFRKENDISRSKFAKILGISQTTVSRRLKKITSKIEACTV